MLQLEIVFNQVLVLILILFIGFVAARRGILHREASKKLSEIILYVTSPMMVLNSFFIEYTAERLKGIAWVLGLGILCFVCSILIAKFAFRRTAPDLAPVYKFATVFSNAGYMGLPLLDAVFGPEGVFYGSFFVILVNVFLWSYGFLLFGGKGTPAQMAKRVLLNPAIIAVYVGAVIFLFRLTLPMPVQQAVSSVGNMTMPLSMMVIGAVISQARARQVFGDKRVYLASTIRLVLMPLMGLLLALILRVPAFPATIVVACLAMPCATATTMFAEMADKDAAFASRTVTVSTILSLISIPLVISMMALITA